MFSMIEKCDKIRSRFALQMWTKIFDVKKIEIKSDLWELESVENTQNHIKLMQIFCIKLAFNYVTNKILRSLSLEI